jgi:digeranylgeranylglycerophospholipid reductase
MRDVVVIGAGPAGSLAAARLAAAGRDVLVIEEHDVVGQPVHCTGLVGVDAFAEFDLPRRLVLGDAGAVRFWGARGESVPVDGRGVSAVVIDRGDLDAYLADQAVDAGAELRRGCRAQRVSVQPDGVRVTTNVDAEPIAARAVVLACGANYRFHKTLGLGFPRTFLQSAQVEAPFATLPEIEVRFGRGVAPGGFAWAVPLVRQGAAFVRLGLMSQDRSRERFHAFAALVSDRIGHDVRAIPTPRLKMLPLAPVPRTYSSRVLAIGDAAGLVKPTTGGGIYYGLISGAIAAEVLTHGLSRDRLDERSLAKYETRWKQRLGQEIRVGIAFRKLAAGLDDQAIDALVDLARVNGIVPLLQRTASFNWHRKAAVALLAHPEFRRVVFRSLTRSHLPFAPLTLE